MAVCVLHVFSKLRIFLSWAFLKLLFGAFILVSTCGLLALWMWEKEGADYAAARDSYRLRVEEDLAKAEQEFAGATQTLADIRQEYAGHLRKAERALQIAASTEELQTTLRRFVSGLDQWKRNAAGIERMREIAHDEKQAAVKLTRPLAQATTRLERAAREQARCKAQQEMILNHDSAVIHYMYRSWMKGQWAFIALTAMYYLGPLLNRMALFYYFAPRIARRRPLLLDRSRSFSPAISECATSVETALWPGERAHVRLRYLRSADDGLVQESRFMMSWRFPLTSLLSGFVHDMNFRNTRAVGGRKLVFAHHKNPDHQMAVVHVPEGGSLVVRPSYLAAAVLPPGNKLRFRRRWQLLRWQSWLTGQLRFLEFVGPCRLVVAGRPALRIERLDARDETQASACRAPVDKVIGFTPGLEYRLIRTTRFWSYMRRLAMLFDAHFSGVGVVLIQTSLPGRTPGLFSATRNRARKLIGL